MGSQLASYFPHWVFRNDDENDETYPKLLLDALPKGTIIGVHHLDDSLSDIERLLNYRGSDGTPKGFVISWYVESNISEPDDPASAPIPDRIRQAAKKQQQLLAKRDSSGSAQFKEERFADLIELDAARERSRRARLSHARVVKENGFRYLAKSLSPTQVKELRDQPDLGADFVPRIVFEDVVHNAAYQADALAHAAAGETLTVVIHQGAYDNDPGTSLPNARDFVSSRLVRSDYRVEAWHGKPRATARSVQTIRLKPFAHADGGGRSAAEASAADGFTATPPSMNPAFVLPNVASLFPEVASIGERKMKGKDILAIASAHVGEKYVLGAVVNYDNPDWTGPWDCAEFTTWCTRQAYGLLFGCDADGEPGSAYTGRWRRDAETTGIIVDHEEATRTPGAFLLRYPAGGSSRIGHIAISVGNGKTIEAADARRGVIIGTVHGRRWDVGVLLPGVDYEHAPSVEHEVLRLQELPEVDARVTAVQLALSSYGFDPGPIDGQFGPQTQAAVTSFQTSRGLVVDGEVGPQTAGALQAEAAAAAREAAPAAEAVAPEVPIKSTNYAELAAEYLALYQTLELRSDWASKIRQAVVRVRAGRVRYEAVAAKVGTIPWYVVGVIHELESGCNFRTHLHNGDPLTRPTVQVPRGRPPGPGPFTWEESAIDALKLKRYEQSTDWRLSRTLWRLEGYNGWGTRRHGIFTPYLWSGSEHYTKGKYIADGRWDPEAVSKQVGCACLIHSLAMGGDISVTVD